MPIRLNIDADSVEEFDTLLARFAPGFAASRAIMPEIADTPAAQDAAKPARRGRKTEAGAPTQNPDGTPIAPVHTPEPQPTPGGTDAPPAESIPPKQEAAVDPFAPAATQNAPAEPAAQTQSGQGAPSETVAATPAATSPADTAAADAGEVTMQQLKDAMSALLKAKSAAVAMATLEQATGCKSLTSGSPSVAEKAKDDPGILRRTLDALVAAKTAA